jgi:glycerol-3-phosphate cytidylyltransferase
MNGITFGSFDLCHTGHVLMFKECRERCDFLYVGLQVDPSEERASKNKPVQDLFERYTQLKAVKWVDEVIPYRYEHEIVTILQALPIHIRFVGEDYIDKDFTGKQYCIDNSIAILYNSRRHNFSTSELRRRLENSCNG